MANNDIFKNIPKSASEYIKLVIKKMRYRKSVRNDVQAELIAHFEDALSDCKTEQEKQKLVKKLIANFGDAKMLGKLARRAKKRCRPLWKKAIIKTFQTTGLIIALFIIYVAWFLNGKPNITVDYLQVLNEQTRPNADESQNAAPFYSKAIEKYEAIPKDVRENLEQLLSNGYHDSNEIEKQFVKNWIEQNNEILDLIRQGSQKDYYWHSYESPEDGSMISILLPHLGNKRLFTRILNWQAISFAEQRNYKQAFDYILNSFKLGKKICNEPFIIGQLVGWSVDNITAQNFSKILMNKDIPVEYLKQIQKVLKVINCKRNFKAEITTEKLFMYDELQRCFTEDFLGGGHLYPKRIASIGSIAGDMGEEYVLIQSAAIAARVLFNHDNREETLKKIEKFYGYVEKALEFTPATQKSQNIDIDLEIVNTTNGNFFLQTFAPCIGKVSEISYRHKVDIEAVQTILAIEIYKKETSKYPENLEQLLEAGYIDIIPIDPFSDKPLGYRKTEDSFVLYSFGLDLDDDGGVMGTDHKGNPRMWDDDGDAVYWPITE